MNLPSSTNNANTPYKILRVYLKGATVEVPHMADLPRQGISPDIGVDMQTHAAPAWPGALECVLRISLHARLAGQDVFMIEVSEAGVFELDLSNMEDAHRFVRQIAPTVLFPFARKDLASLAVSAGFQPVLLDHVDFDAMLTQVIKSQRLTREPAPMRVDVIAGKPGMPVVPAPAPAQEEVDAQELPVSDASLESVWQATAPSALAPAPQWSRPAPGIEAGGIEPGKPRKKGLQAIALALLGTASLAAMLAWWLEPGARSVPPPVATAPVPELVAPAAPLAPPASDLAPVIVVPQETQVAIETSRARLADQPAAWFTLDMGSVPVSTPLASLQPLPPERPLFVLAAQADTLRVLYGVFPSQAAAERVRNQLQRSEAMQGQQLATVVAIGSL